MNTAIKIAIEAISNYIKNRKKIKNTKHNTAMKKIEIEIPDGKKCKWVSGILVLIDDEPKDIKERIRTFEDAVEALGKTHPFVRLYSGYMQNISDSSKDDKDVIAYLKLRIIVAALNEGWEPNWTDTNEYKHYSWFRIYSKEEYDQLSDNVKKKCCRVVGRASLNANAHGGLVCSSTVSVSSLSSSYCGSRLAFKTKELAEYAGQQFINIWCDFLCK